MDLLKNKSIISRLRNGDRNVFELLYWQHRKALYGLAFRYLKDHELAEDAVHDVFIKLWDSKGQLDDEKSLQGYIFTTLKNHVLNVMKTDNRRILRHLEYTEVNREKSGYVPEEDLFHADLKSIVENGLKQLPVGKRQIYKMKRVDGYTNEEIASILDISVHTVKSQFYRANEFLRSYVTKYEQHEKTSASN